MSEGWPELHRRDVASDPLAQFQRWFGEAAAAIPLAEAAALATADRTGQPSVRMVLVKGWDARGFSFYTNHQSRKGGELAANARAALLFYWPSMGRQVRIEGPVDGVSDEESDEYFASRPRASQLGALASAQSQPVESRAVLDGRVADLERSWKGRPVKRPKYWGGYRLEPVSYEFWQHRMDRLHDRLRYLYAGAAWRVDRLQP